MTGAAMGGGSSTVLLPLTEHHPMTDVNTKLATRPQRRMAREPGANGAMSGMPRGTGVSAAPVKRPSKTSLVLEMLSRMEGATLAQLVAATGWLPHTARAALTGLKKKGHALASEKLEGSERVYRVPADEGSDGAAA